MGRIFVLGSLNYDLVINSDRMPENGETVSGFGFMTNCGGKGANQAVASARAGAETFLIGRVGEDHYGDILRSQAEFAGIKTDFLKTAKGTNSGVAVIVVVDRDNRIILDAGANAKLEISDVDAALSDAGKADYLVVQFEISAQVVAHALKLAKEKGMTTVVNPAPARQTGREILAYTDYLIPNEHEVFGISEGGRDLVAAAAAVGKLGAKHVVVTLGAKGAAYFGEGKEISVPSPKAEPVDTTAAGDTFIGYFTAGLSEGKTVKESMELACRAASITITRRGAQCSIPKRNEL